MRIFLGLIGVILSLLLIIYRVPVKHFIGNIAWAEAHLGSGGTFTLLLLFGVFGFFASLMIMTGTVDLLFGKFAETLFGASAQ